MLHSKLRPQTLKRTYCSSACHRTCHDRACLRRVRFLEETLRAKDLELEATGDQLLIFKRELDNHRLRADQVRLREQDVARRSRVAQGWGGSGYLRPREPHVGRARAAGQHEVHEGGTQGAPFAKRGSPSRPARSNKFFDTFFEFEPQGGVQRAYHA
eukprot:TRINITY_DN1763_c0_g1_i4.p1 TRINITY_DN1763_c0_g1~~TRINITY_DN1763_c0_g1_i4.p1  ORF type:complete len:157 (+),score=19.73 TRINITY_DN1763_c0_g1_i4:169-639(+)